MSIENLVEDYLRYLADINRSPYTIRSNRVSLFAFISFLNGRDLSLEEVMIFIHELSNRPGRTGRLTPQTIWTRVCCIKCFLRWLDTYKGIKYFDYDLIAYPCPKRSRITYLTAEEFCRIVGLVDTRSFEGKRLRAMLEVYMSTGARMSEILNLKLSDINLIRGEATVKRKGGEWQLVYLNKRAIKWVSIYMLFRDDNNPYLWVSRKFGVSHLSPTSLQSQVQVFKERNAFGKNWSLHTIRHSFATQLMQNNANLRVVQSLMGHKSIQSTVIYTHLSDQDLKRAHKKYLHI